MVTVFKLIVGGVFGVLFALLTIVFVLYLLKKLVDNTKITEKENK